MDALFLDFLNISITASYIILAVILVRFLFPKIPRKFICILWAIAGIRLVLPFSIESIFSLIPSAETVPPDIVMSQSPVIHSGITTLNSVVNPIISNALAPEVGASVNPMQIITGIASVVWLVGMAAMFIYGVVSYFRVKKTVTGAVILCDNIWQSEKVVSPFILGIIKPKIYIPFGMDGEVQSHVIAHENAHLKRRDHWIKPLGFILLTVYWFNPLVWIAYILLCKDIERACDEKVISHMSEENRREYATALLECAVNRRRIAACPLAFGETGLKERVKGVMNYKKPAFWVIILAVIACIVAAVCFLTNPETPEKYSDLGYRLNVTVETYTATTQFPDKTEKESYKVGKGTKGELSNGTKFVITETNLQTGELTIKFSGEPIYSIIESSVDGGSKECGHIVLNENTPLTLSADSNGVYRRITFEFVKTEDFETFISQAITQRNKGNYKSGTFACENHEIFATEASGPADNNNIETVTAYMWVDYAEFIKYGDSLVEIGGSSMPTALTFECLDGTYTLVEYWTSEDGTRYVDSIREKFPKNVVDEVLSYTPNRKGMEKKAEAFYYDNRRFYTATNCDSVTVNVMDYDLKSDGRHITIEWCNHSDKETVTYGHPFSVERFNPDILGFEPYGPEGMSFTTPSMLLEPGETRQQKYSLELFDFSQPGYYRFITNFYTNEKVGGGTAIVDFTVGDIALEEKNPEELTTQAVFADNDFKALFSRVEYTDKGKELINKYAEKSIYTQYSSQTPFPIIRFDSKDELDGFIQEGRKAFCLDSDWEKGCSFLENTKEYTEEFFEDKSVILVNIKETSGSIRHEIDSVTKSNGTAYIIMDRIVPEEYTDDMASWFITISVDEDFLSNCNNIVASMGDEVYVPVNTTAKAVKCSVVKSTVNYLENGGEILAEHAEIPIKAPDGGVDYYLGARFETSEGFEKFYNNTKNIFSYESVNGYSSFNQAKSQFNERFFEENTLFIFYIAEPSIDISHEIMFVGKGDNDIFIEMRRYIPEAYDTAMGGNLIAVSVKKGDAKDVDSAVIIITETVNIEYMPEVAKTEPGTLLYIMRTSDSYTKPRVTLKADGSFHFFISPYSSYFCTGIYHLEQGNVILETDDGLYTYVFKEDGNNLIFDADSSSAIQEFKPSANAEPVAPVQDGDVFTKA